jgi:hypothetical protein
MELKELIKDNFLSQFLKALGTILGFSLGAYIITDGFKKIPPNFSHVLFPILILCLIVFLLYKRYNKVKSYDNTFYGTAIGYPYGGLKKIGYREHKGVIWDVECPVGLKPSPNNIEIDTTPKCPECKIELKQTYLFLGGFKWKCVECGFEIKNKDNWSIEAKQVKNKVKRDFEIRK